MNHHCNGHEDLGKPTVMSTSERKSSVPYCYSSVYFIFMVVELDPWESRWRAIGCLGSKSCSNALFVEPFKGPVRRSYAAEA